MIYMDVTSSCKSPMNTGVQRMVRGFYRSLSRAGHPVTPLVWDPGRRSYCLLSQREHGFLREPFGGFFARRRRAAPERWANPIPLWSKFWRQVKRRGSQFDLVAQLKSDDTFFLPEIFQDNRIEWLSELRAETSARRAAVFHDAIAWRRPDFIPKRNGNFVAYMRALESFDEVLAVSHEAANDLRDFGRQSEMDLPSIQVSAWPVDDLFTAPRKKSPALAAQTRPNILCVGTFEPRKNHLIFLEAAEKIWREKGPTFEITLIGRRTKAFGGRVIAKVNHLRRDGWPVKWHRHVDDHKLVRAYDACAFTVFPSRAEGFGLPIIESLRRGRPCICGANGSLGERARGGGCVLVDQTNAIALAEAISHLLTDQEFYQRLAREARARRFETWEEFIARQHPLFSASLAYA